MKASIVIPAYNEEKGIELVIREIKAVSSEFKLPVEIIVVDDGSRDQTAHIAKKQRIKVVTHPQNAGYGAAIQTGIKAAKYENILMCDADGTYPLKEFPRLLKFLDDGFDMAVGARQGRHYRGSMLKHPARLFFKFLSEFVTGTKIPDVNSGFRAFKKSTVLPFLRSTCPTFSFTTSLTLIYHLEGKFIKYYPVNYLSRQGKSKVNYFRDTLRAGQILTETIAYYNPIKLFLLVALFFSFFILVFLGFYIVTRSIFFLTLFSLCFLSTVSSICLGFVASIFKKDNQ